MDLGMTAFHSILRVFTKPYIPLINRAVYFFLKKKKKKKKRNDLKTDEARQKLPVGLSHLL